MAKKNCWEFMVCDYKECPSHHERRMNGVHGGVNAGRACWVVAGTRCGGRIQGNYAQKIGNCMKCDFYLDVVREEGAVNIKNGLVLLEVLK